MHEISQDGGDGERERKEYGKDQMTIVSKEFSPNEHMVNKARNFDT